MDGIWFGGRARTRNKGAPPHRKILIESAGTLQFAQVGSVRVESSCKITENYPAGSARWQGQNPTQGEHFPNTCDTFENCDFTPSVTSASKNAAVNRMTGCISRIERLPTLLRVQVFLRPSLW